MYVYRVTLTIDKDTEHEWLEFMQQKHIAEVLATGYFSSCSIRKLMNEREEQESVYAMEYLAATEEAFKNYQEYSAPVLQADVANRFGGRYSAKRAFYKIVSEITG